ncbi:multiple epidermal growth factor-like domains protein 10 [Ylistrum balloti]|uniref:multiple epidermal growth factor-like domains protein 10 n=1 Tax=Ylistrum balloti TaxID=509963 RepID=UPI002905DC6E|nr:multiple epidermal growth factor-like domains protein 10 [Ylistrum balloti]
MPYNVNTCREPSVKTTYQSSSLNAGTGSSRAVDGCTNQRYSSGCCMHTSVNGQVEAWWLVDFAEQIVVESIQIYYRDEGVSQQQSRFGGYQIFMTNTTSENLDISPCYQDTTSSRSAVDLTPTITACCPVGKFGSGNCDLNCDSSCILNRCDPTNGVCTSCLAGYHGTLCDQLCPSGCKDNICDQMTGQCHACFNGFFGSTCNQTCSVNCQNSVCGQLAGECEACVPGFYSSTCDQFCPSNCKDNTCNQLDGSCIACVPGYYGSSCDLSCPSNCKDNTCIQLDGLCTECNSGYYGSSCNQICPVNCKSTICNRSSGECTECEAGVFGVLCDNSCSALCSSDGCSQETGFCKACTPGYYGQTCMENCGQCSSVSCNIADGTCDCSDGWEGDTCNTRKAVVDTPHNNTWTYVGGAIGAIIAIALLVAVFIVLKRRRQGTSYQKNPPEIVDNTFDKVEMTPDIVPRQSMYDHTAARHTAATDENEIAYANVKDTAPRTEEEAAYHNFKAKAAYMSVHELQAIIDTKMANGAAGFQEEFKICNAECRPFDYAKPVEQFL